MLDGQVVFPFQPTWLRNRNLADQHVIFDMDYHFAKPQSNGGVLLKKPTSPWNTVSMYLALFRSNMKQNRLEKQNFHVMRNCPGCNQMTFPATRSAHELNYEFTSQSWFATHACSRLFSERNDTTGRRKSVGVFYVIAFFSVLRPFQFFFEMLGSHWDVTITPDYCFYYYSRYHYQPQLFANPGRPRPEHTSEN